jgi:hypothetical protein
MLRLAGQPQRYNKTDAEGHVHDSEGKFTGTGGGESKKKSKAAEKPAGPDPEKVYHSVPHFADVVHRLAVNSPAADKFHDNKVFIEPLWRASQRDESFPMMSLEHFKSMLVKSNAAGLLHLSRADMVSHMDPETVGKSKIEIGGGQATFNFVRIPEPHEKLYQTLTGGQGFDHSATNREIEKVKKNHSLSTVKLSDKQIKAGQEKYDFYKSQGSTDWDRIQAIEKNWGNLPPIIVGGDSDDWWITDGDHRFAVASKMGLRELPAYMPKKEKHTRNRDSLVLYSRLSGGPLFFNGEWF